MQHNPLFPQSSPFLAPNPRSGNSSKFPEQFQRCSTPSPAQWWLVTELMCSIAVDAIHHHLIFFPMSLHSSPGFRPAFLDPQFQLTSFADMCVNWLNPGSLDFEIAVYKWLMIVAEYVCASESCCSPLFLCWWCFPEAWGSDHLVEELSGCKIPADCHSWWGHGYCSVMI